VASLVTSLKKSLAVNKRRHDDVRRLVKKLGRQDFERRHPDAKFGPVLALIASYLEADNIGPVLKAVPDTVEGLDVTTLVVVDGGDDGTEDIVEGAGALCAVLPVNMGQGVALQLGYELAQAHGCRYVVTIDADGQNDPGEVPELLAPVIAGTSDFVIASRRHGVDETTDRMRKSGVVFFASVINRIIGKDLTDTSNGYRAFRTEVLADLTLEQDQYQTAEVIITAAARGWRITEVPTVWHPRASGESKKGHNVYFGMQYARVIVRTWWRERHHS
jgi:glycosyltransferase involved in cell wall biosynthesis